MRLRSGLERILTGVWYGRSWLRFLLAPPALIYCAAVVLRHYLYHSGMLTRYRFPAPVFVVGNLIVGGTGKTPLVICLAQWLQARGYRVGISASGYGGTALKSPCAVTADSDPDAVGDEAVLLVQRSACPVQAGSDRVGAVRALIDAGCDLILCDDGLQHERLQPDLALLVIDAETRFGNGWCLPAGPLREPASRVKRVDALIASGGAIAGAVAMELDVVGVFPLDGAGDPRPLGEFAGRAVHAVAGIARPERFFARLRAAGLTVEAHAFPDHHRFSPGDIRFSDGRPVLMTEKDAVKCRRFAEANTWSVRVEAHLPPEFLNGLLDRLNS